MSKMHLTLTAVAVALAMSPVWAADQEYKTDIVVIGAGASGTAAAWAAAEKDFNVITLEKAAMPGGTGQFSEGIFAVESKMQRDWNYGLTKDEAFQKIMNYGHWRGNAKMVRAFVNKSADTIDWMMKNGVKFEKLFSNYPNGLYTWHIYEGRGAGWINLFQQKYKEKGQKLLLNTWGEKLLTENGRVVGVEATNKAGDKITIHAKATIIATGGFAANKEMLAQYVFDSSALGMVEPIWLRGPVVDGRTGDGINMARLVGAHVAGMHAVAGNAPYLPDVPPINQFSGPDELKQGRCALAQPWLWVDHTGRRFFNESRGSVFVDVYNAMTTAGGVSYTIFDQEKMDRMIQKGAVLPFNAIVLAETPLKALPKTWEIGQQRGWAFKADTIEELAEKLHLPVEAFKATVERYNGFVKNGNDLDYGKEPFRLTPVNQGPFYGAKNTGDILCTMDGIVIDTNMNAIDTEGNAIPGLYVIGNDSGAYFANTYPNLSTGMACGRTVTFGRHVGKYLAKL